MNRLNMENLCCHVLNTRIYSLLFFFFVRIEICGNKKDIGYRKSLETNVDLLLENESNFQNRFYPHGIRF